MDFGVKSAKEIVCPAGRARDAVLAEIYIVYNSIGKAQKIEPLLLKANKKSNLRIAN